MGIKNHIARLYIEFLKCVQRGHGRQEESIGLISKITGYLSRKENMKAVDAVIETILNNSILDKPYDDMWESADRA